MSIGNKTIVQRFSVTDIQNVNSEALGRATIEPVLLTTDSHPSYVIMSIENYEHLIDRLAQLEDFTLGRQAQAAIETSRMVGTEIFTAELQRLAALDSNG